jgi:TolB-like protein/tetratricopeptide (TPR) repeat protein
MNGCLNDVARWCSGLAVAVLACAAPPSAAAAELPAAARPTIAVLPFENVSLDPRQNFFPAGMTDEIAAALAAVHGLAVVARSSSFQLKPPPPFPTRAGESGEEVKAAGRALNALYLVQGTTRITRDEHAQLAVRLVQASDGAELWSQDYDTEPEGIFDVEENVARAIASSLKVSVGPDPLVRSYTEPYAYLDFLRAKVAARPRGAAALGDAAAFLEKVLARDPEFAPAAALLAYDYALTPLFAPSLRGGNPEEERKIVERTIPKGEALARRAIQLDPNSAEAFVALGYISLVQLKMVAAEDAFKQALALNPDQADGLHGYSQFLAAMGRIKESLAMREHLQAVEQFIINYTADTAEIYWLDGDVEKAVAMLQPFRPGRTLELALVEASAGRYREAAAALREMPATNYPQGMLEAAAKVLESAPAKATEPAALPRLGNMSFAYMHVGAPERVLEFYEDEVKGGYFQPISTTWFWHPTYAAVRKTERFKTVARNLGLVDYWRERGWPAQCRPAGNDFACD